MILFCITWISFFLMQDGSGYDSNSKAEGRDDFFYSDSLLDLTLIADLDSLLVDVGEDPAYHDGRLIYTEPGGSQVQIRIKARARGKFRKKPENCNFPPLKIKFSEEDTPGTLFEGIPDLKIVSHCQSELPEFEQYVLQEYLIYKLYNILTDLSFRVRLARIRYLDQGNLPDSVYHFAFFIENPEAMAARNGGRLLDLQTIPQNRIDREQLMLVTLFNYMIINTDYSVPILHNLELVSMDYFEPPLPVPFDFDWSGMINIPYNYNYNPGKGYPRREFKGPCWKRRELRRGFTKMKEKRFEVFKLYAAFPYLNPAIKARTLYDLNNFYGCIENRKLVREEFMKNCYK